MSQSFRFCMSVVLLAAMTAVFAGCNSDEPVATTGATSDAGAPFVPSFSEVEAAVSLDADDAALVKTALAEWRQTAAEASKTEPAGRPRAGMTFVATVTPSLDNAQLGDLVDFLVEYRETHMRRPGNGLHGRGDGDRDRDRARDRLHDQLAERLGLTSDQQAAMKALHQETREKAREQHQAFRDGTITEAQFDDAMDALHDAQREKLAGILTPEQMAKFEALHEQRRERRFERRAERVEVRAEKHAELLATALELSDAQKVQVEAALSSFAEKQKAGFASAGTGDMTRVRMHERMQAEHDALVKTLEGILTAEQSARLQILRRLHPHGPHDL